MYTAKIIKKELIGGVINVTVEFSDGVTTVTETCEPQDEVGFKHWVKSRLNTFNASKAIDATYEPDAVVDVSDATPEAPAPTQAEIDRDEWYRDYNKWVMVKTSLIDTGILTGDEPPAVALKNKVRTNFKASYINLL